MSSPSCLARPVGDALRRPEDGARPLAGGLPPLDDQRAVGRVDLLVVGVVERLLVHVEEDQRTFGARRRGGMHVHGGRLAQPAGRGHIARRRALPRKRSAPADRLPYICRSSALRPPPAPWPDSPALAVCSSFMAIGISRCTSARPLGAQRHHDLAARLFRAAARHQPDAHQPAHQPRHGRGVDRGHAGRDRPGAARRCWTAPPAPATCRC